jgi:hypothetical protein
VACALVVLGAACQGYSTDLKAPVAIEIISPRVPPGNLEEFDTLRLGVRVLDRAGDSMPGATVRFRALDTTIVVDSVKFFVTGRVLGTGRVIATANNLQSAPLVVTVLRAPDSLGTTGASVDTVLATDTVSAPLSAELFDLRSDTVPHGLNWGALGDTVRFAIISPVFGSLAAATVTLGNDSLTAAVVTSTATPGVAIVKVRRQGAPPQPDSVVVQASARRASGAAVRGSPVQFVVHFQ